MYNFFNNTTNQHHDHDHDAAGSDVYPNDGDNSNSESMHDNQDRNQHKQEKESTDMNRTINNSITPILLGFAASIMFIFSLPAKADALTRDNFKFDNFKVNTIDNFKRDNLNYDRKDLSDRDDQLVRFINGNIFDRNAQDFARDNGKTLINFKNTNFVDDENFARLDANRSVDDNDKRLAGFDKKDFDNGFVGDQNDDVKNLGNYRVNRFDDRNVDDFNNDINNGDFSRNDFAS